jgi:putative transposase
MQIYYPHKKVYHIKRIDESEYSKKAYVRYDKLLLYQKLRREGCTEETAFEAIGMSRATFFRLQRRYKVLGLAGLEDGNKRPHQVRKPLWDSKTEKIVLAMRHRYPFWGKQKLAIMIKRELKTTISPSTIGRILKKALSKGKIKSVAFYFGTKEFKPRTFNGHAKRLPTGAKPQKPGELLQVDHMQIKLEGIIIKHFKAICPVTKIVVEQAYTSATSTIAAEFLQFMTAQFPFTISSIQVDGGAEFMGEFEKGCKAQNIPLYVLPPRSPELNGTVERGNGTVKYEFYQQYDGPSNLKGVQKALQNYVAFYNTVRPHQTLKYLTPKEYYSEISKQAL